jgi:hypothetical protein
MVRHSIILEHYSQRQNTSNPYIKFLYRDSTIRKLTEIQLHPNYINRKDNYYPIKLQKTFHFLPMSPVSAILQQCSPFLESIPLLFSLPVLVSSALVQACISTKFALGSCSGLHLNQGCSGFLLMPTYKPGLLWASTLTYN